MAPKKEVFYVSRGIVTAGAAGTSVETEIPLPVNVSAQEVVELVRFEGNITCNPDMTTSVERLLTWGIYTETGTTMSIHNPEMQWMGRLVIDFTTSGVLVLPSEFGYDFVPGTAIIARSPMYAFINDSEAVAAPFASTVSFRLFYRITQVSEAELIAYLT